MHTFFEASVDSAQQCTTVHNSAQPCTVKRRKSVRHAPEESIEKYIEPLPFKTDPKSAQNDQFLKMQIGPPHASKIHPKIIRPSHRLGIHPKSMLFGSVRGQRWARGTRTFCALTPNVLKMVTFAPQNETNTIQNWTEKCSKWLFLHHKVTILGSVLNRVCFILWCKSNHFDHILSTFGVSSESCLFHFVMQ